jgi:hypothetical protein
MQLFNFSFTNEGNIIFFLLLLIMIIMIVSILSKSTKNNNQEQNDNMWLPYEQFEPVDQSEQLAQLNQSEESEPELELVFPGRSFEAPIIEEPHVIDQLDVQQKQLDAQQKQMELQQKQFNELNQQIQISSLNNEQLLSMSQEPSYNFVPFIQKLFEASNDTNTVSQEQVKQNINTVSQEVEDTYAGFNEFNNEIDYTNVEQTQIPVEQKVSDFSYNKSIEQVNPIDLIDNYSSF